MADAPIGDKFMALPHSPARAEHDDELVPLVQVKAIAAGGSTEVLEEILTLLRSVLYVGKMEWSGFRPDALKPGWYPMLGAKYPDTSPQGRALLSLPETFRNDWGIAVDAECRVNLPNVMCNGKGYFVRACDGTTRQVGSVEEDAGREVIAGDGKGKFSAAFASNTYPTAEGIFAAGQTFQRSEVPAGGTQWLGGAEISIDLRAGISIENIADEYRPLNVAMMLIVYLGV